MSLLTWTKVRQNFPRPRLDDVRSAVIDELTRMKPLLRPDTTLAIAVGSRGISGIADIVRTTVDFVQAQGVQPFIVPAMGSHGGATAEGQIAVLASYGITQETMGVPIRSSMATVELPAEGFPNRMFMDRYAYEADGVMLINRIKAHTDYHGSHESGLAKMTVIGLGKHRQALEVHSFGVRGLQELLPATARHILGLGKILFGLAIVENAYDETMLVNALRADEIMAEEPNLLAISKANMPRLPVDQIDVLMVDWMGKDISGSGLDPNIIGRIMIRGVAEPKHPQIKAIVVGDLTAASHGNAVGVGFADVITQELFDKIDFGATYENIFTSTFLERGKIPIIAKSSKQAYTYALRSCGRIDPGQERVVRILDTLHLGEAYVSPAVLDDIRDRPDITVIGGSGVAFDEQGRLSPFVVS